MCLLCCVTTILNFKYKPSTSYSFFTKYSFNIMEYTNTFEIHEQELKKFQKEHSKAFRDKSATSLVLPESSFSLLSSEERAKLSTIYFHLAKAIIDIPEGENQLQALDYLNASTNLDPLCNKGAYSMIAKFYATNNNQIAAYANVLIAMKLGEISYEDELFIQVAQQCKNMSFPTKIRKVQHDNYNNSIDYHLSEDLILILEPGTYTITMPIEDKNIIIIGIGKVIIKHFDFFELDSTNVFDVIDSKLVLYNIRVECTRTKGHSLFLTNSQAFIDSCQFTKCSGSNPPICASDRKTLLFMNKCQVVFY
jgi:hypothetical protein